MNFTSNSTRLGPSADKTTYMLFVLEQGVPTKIAGPVFGNEIDIAKQKFFTFGYNVQVMQEPSFASRYSKQYWEHIKMYWLDKIFTYCIINQEWIGNTNIFPQEKGVQSQWFSLFEITDGSGEKVLQLSHTVDANPFFVSKLKLDIIAILPHKLTNGTLYYNSSDGFLYTGSRATQKSLAENCLKTMCLQ